MTVGVDFCARVGIEIPIVQAPMAGSGGVALAIAVAQAGGLGSLPAAMLSSDQLAEQIDEFRRATDAPLNVNFFCHELPEVSPSELEAWTAKLSRFDAELGVDRSSAPAGPSRRPFDDEACRIVEEPSPGGRQLPLRPAGAGARGASPSNRCDRDVVGDDPRRGGLARQRLMPKTYLRFNEPAFFPAVNSGSLGLAANGSLVVATNNVQGPTSSGLEAANVALALDGTNSWASFNAPAALNLSGQISLEAWIKPAATQGTTARILSHGPPVLSNFVDPDGTSQVETNTAPTVASEVALKIVDGASYSVGAYDGTNFYGAAAPIPAGDSCGDQWVHLVGTYDGTEWRLFRNGQQLTNAASTIGAFIINLADGESAPQEAAGGILMLV